MVGDVVLSNCHAHHSYGAVTEVTPTTPNAISASPTNLRAMRAAAPTMAKQLGKPIGALLTNEAMVRADDFDGARRHTAWKVP